MLPKVSVVIPTCNRRLDSLLNAVQSVICQCSSMMMIEIIVVDDNKVNQVLKIENTLPKHSFIRVVRNEFNHSAAFARNCGVRAASGDYIVFLDDDDVFMPGRISSMLKIALSNKYVIISSGRIIEYDNFSSISLVRNQVFKEFSFDTITYGNDIDIGFMIKRDLFLELDGFDTNLSSLEDWDFILRVLRKGQGYKIERFDYVVNRSEFVSRVSDNESKGYLLLAEKWKDELPKKWYAFMLSTSYRLNKSLTLEKAVQLSLKYECSIPLKQYLGSKLKNA
jgi:glycosyltransferase involved in cell wall biosynthesis